MANEDDGVSIIRRDILHFLKRLFLETRVPHRKDFIDQKDLRFEVRCDREGQAHIHAAGIPFHRRIEELVNLSKGNDLVELALNFDASHAEDSAIEKNVFAPGQFRMKTCSNFEKRADPAVDVYATAGRLCNPI